ncbi:MAG: pyridoxamine 5'-phosphate oxidase [Deltaproteobacteria bacterium]|nr:pyridoxamine 5'-phosphate oxidase [Deltaproteobacteria bacterium]
MDVIGGPWLADAIESYLRTAVLPIRLASISADGSPVVLSLWYLYEEESIWCATKRVSRVVARLEREPRCGFEIAADTIPYRGIRGRAQATIDVQRGAILLPRLIHRYLGGTDSPLASWLLAHSENEVAIRLDQLRVSTWDFTARMTN